MNKNNTIGLMRHGGSETGGSVQYYFSSLENGLRSRMQSHFEFVRLPSYYTQLPARRIESVMLDFLTKCDVVLVNAGGIIDHVTAPFLVRDKYNLDCRFIYNPLGEFPRGAAGFRSLGPLFRETDSIYFSCSADRIIYQQMTEQMKCHDRLTSFGIDTDHFCPQPEDACKKLRWQLGIPEDATLLLYTGRITSEKNIHTLLAVYKKLIEQHKKLFLLLLGDVEDVEFVEFRTGPHDLKAFFREQITPEMWQHLLFFGSVDYDDLPLFYSTADIFVNLTVHHDENFGYTQVEAMSCGTAVVGSDWGGLKDTIEHHQTGYKIPCYVTEAGIRVDQWATFTALENLISNSQQRKDYGQAARTRIVDSFSVDRHCKDIHDLVVETLKRENISDKKNKLSQFGKSLIEHLDSTSKTTEKTNSRFRPARPFFEIGKPSYELYRQLIRPYATDDPVTEIHDQRTVIFLCSPFISIENKQITIDDPLWPFQYQFSNALEKEICERLGHHHFLSVEILSRKVGDEKEKTNTAIHKLLKQGVLMANKRDPI